MNVGMTGHQKLDDPEAWLWVTDAMRAEISKMSKPLVGVTSLAIGADQLLARLVLEFGGAVHAVLPYKDIERSFASKDLQAYRDLVEQSTIEVLNTPGTDEDAYLAAGKRVVDLSDIMLAVWDGEPAKGKGGTADVVSYAQETETPVVILDPVRRSCLRLPINLTACPRKAATKFES
jgi:hypothetical protein